MKNSHIEWTDHTFNPWIGCTKVSPGCVNCYAEARDQRFAKGVHWGKGAPRQRMSASYWKQPLKWNLSSVCEDCGKHTDLPKTVPGVCPKCYGELRRPRVFCASLADWLDDEVPIEWLADLLKLIHDTPNLDWLLLTKRPQNWQDRVGYAADYMDMCSTEIEAVQDWVEGKPMPNIWLGTSVEDQSRADERIPALLDIPARVRFLSCEPLLGPVNLTSAPVPGGFTHYLGGLHGECRPEHGLPDAMIHWVICGGESGPGARPMHPDWAKGLRDQCLQAGVAFFFKQWGEWIPHARKEDCDDNHIRKNLHREGHRWLNLAGGHGFHGEAVYHVGRVGKKNAGRLLDGRTWEEFPNVEVPA